jgi:hypothetical protein
MDPPDGLTRTRGERGGVAVRAAVGLVVLALLGAVGFLGSEVNHRRYRLAVEDGQLLVERGRMLPVGFEAYLPAEEALRAAYAPIALPPGVSVDTTVVHGERGDLDRALFDVLVAWADARLAAPGDEAMHAATSYLARAELLPGLSEDQRHRLHGLRGELSYRHGLARIADAMSQLEQAREELLVAERLGPARSELQDWITELEKVSRACRELAVRVRPATVAPTTSPTPSPASTGPTAVPHDSGPPPRAADGRHD